MKSIIASLLFLSKYSSGSSWDYVDQHWDHHGYEMCGTSDQSPINIQSHSASYDDSVCSPALNWTLDWSQHAFQVKNGGHSLVITPLARTAYLDDDINYENETLLNDDDGKEYTTLTLPPHSIGRLQNQFLPENSMHSEFCLHSFHFHWGEADDEGSEHWLDDIQYPLEVHFVHYSCETGDIGSVLGKYATGDNVTDATEAGEDTHELAVVGIFFEIQDYDNPAFDAILSEDILDAVEFSGDTLIIDDLYLQDLIPEGVFTDGFYAYEGSLTTPPCTNIVRWHVMNSMSYISESQLARFRELLDGNNATQAPNFRDPQSNINTVYACMAEYTTTDEPVEEEEVNKTERAIVWVYAVFALLLMISMAGICYYRSIRAERAALTEPETKPARGRVMSRSSIGTHTQTTDHGAHH